MPVQPEQYADFFKELASVLENSTVLWNEPMSRHTSFRIGGPADLLVMPRSVEDAGRVFLKCRKNGVPCHVMGNGTNLLVRDGGIRGVVLKMSPDLDGIGLSGETVLQAGAGTLLSDLLRAACDFELSGLEFAVGIPGSVGGAVVMNAGAYDGEVSSLILRVEVLDEDGRTFWIDGKDLGFGYRDSIFQHRRDLVVLAAEFKLTRGDRAKIEGAMKEYMRRREEKQPLDLPSAGSTFRRPPGTYVGPLIEKAGLKGVAIGGAQVSPKHAGFIVNTGGAKARDVLQLMDLVVSAVYETSGIVLEPEIVIIGQDEISAGPASH